MEKFLASWIVFQLLLIGLINGNITYQMETKGCIEKPEVEKDKEWEYEVVELIIPLKNSLTIQEYKVCE